jgi:RHS repeat-associated protein
MSGIHLLSGKARVRVCATAVLLSVLFWAGSVEACPPPGEQDWGFYDFTFPPDMGDPVSAGDGAYHFSLPLLRLGGPLPLAYSLNYRLNWWGDWTQSGRFRGNVNHVIEWIVEDGQTTADVFLGSGKLIDFELEGGNWETPESASIAYVLKETGANYEDGYYYLMDPIGELVYIFEKGPDPFWCGSDYCMGRIRYIVDRNSNRHTYVYSGNNLYPDRIEDGLGRWLDFAYSEIGGRTLLTRVSDQGGRHVDLNYERNAPDYRNWTVLRSVTDAMGQTTIFHYFFDGVHDCGAIVQVDRPLGNSPYTQVIGWENLDGASWCRVTSQTDAYGNTSTFAYDPNASQVTETRPDGTTVTYEFFHNVGRLQRMTDPLGNTTTFGQTANQQVSQMIDRLGDSTELTYHPETGKVASLTDAAGNTTTFTYVAQAQTITNPANGETVDFTFYRLARIDYPDGTHKAFTYDARGNLLSSRNRRGKTRTFTYNARGQVLSATNPTAGARTYTYNADGNLATLDDSETGTITYGYDGFKRLNQITYPDTNSIQITYNANNQVTSFTNANGGVYAFDYNANGKLVEISDPLGGTIGYEYDLMDRRIAITNRKGETITAAYDNMGRAASITDPNGLVTQYGYDARGWMNQVTLGDDSWQIAHDAEGVVSSRTSPMGHVVEYLTNQRGAVIQTANPLGYETDLTRDAFGRVTQVTDPLERSTDFTYAGVGWLMEVTSPLVGTATYQRDDLGSITATTDLNGQDWTYTYSPRGRLLSETDPLGNSWGYAYDNRGRRYQTTFPDGETLTLTYDAIGHPTNATYSGGLSFDYTYDALGRLLAAEDIAFAYDAGGMVSSTVSSGVAFDAAYDNGDRLVTATYADGAFSVQYAYDAVTGLLSRVTDSLTGAQIDFTYNDDRMLTGLARSNGVNTAYTLDAAGRLSRLQHGAVGDLQYSRDDAGQITRIDASLPLDPANLLTARTENFSYDAAGQVSNAGFVYDGRGRLTAQPGRTYTWDSAGRWTGLDGVSLGYNGLGNLVSRSEDGETTTYYYNYAFGLRSIMAERAGADGPWMRYYVYTPAGRLLYMIDAEHGNQVIFYHFDHLGNSLFLTNQAGAVSDTYAYDPNGRLLAHQGNSDQPFTFGGELGVRQEGSDGALYQMRARPYDAVSARFLSRDPMGPPIRDPLQLNPYQYAVNNPVSYVDPLGLYYGDPTDYTLFDMQNSLSSMDYWLGDVMEPQFLEDGFDPGEDFFFDLGDEYRDSMQQLDDSPLVLADTPETMVVDMLNRSVGTDQIGVDDILEASAWSASTLNDAAYLVENLARGGGGALQSISHVVNDAALAQKLTTLGSKLQTIGNFAKTTGAAYQMTAMVVEGGLNIYQLAEGGHAQLYQYRYEDSTVRTVRLFTDTASQNARQFARDLDRPWYDPTRVGAELGGAVSTVLDFIGIF